MKIGDVIIIILTVAFSIMLAFVTISRKGDAEDFSFSVRQGADIILEKTVEREYKGVHAFKFDNQTGYIEVDRGQVKFLKMSKDICPRQICSDLGWADRQGDILVCLPNKLMVEVIDRKGEAIYGADTISF